MLRLGWLEGGCCSGFRRVRQRPSGCGTSIPEWNVDPGVEPGYLEPTRRLRGLIQYGREKHSVGSNLPHTRSSKLVPEKATQGGEGTK